MLFRFLHEARRKTCACAHELKKIVEFIGKCVKKCEFCINIQEQKDNEIEKLVEKKSAHVLDLRWTVNQ